MPKTILLVEDEASIADVVVYALKTEGFNVIWKALGHEGLTLLKEQPVDLVILDVGLSDISGFEACKQIRSFSDLPVIFLTARKEEIDRVVGLEIGADDYVVKPFSPRELTARVKAILKRSSSAMVIPVITAFKVDENTGRIFYHSQMLDLTRYEYRLLNVLLSRPGRIFSREQLMEMAWESPEASMDRTIDAHIKSLRAKLKKLDAGSDVIKTHRGLGYSLET